MESRGIMSKIKVPTSGWANNLVVVEKADGSLRRNLNVAIKCVLMPTFR